MDSLIQALVGTTVTLPQYKGDGTPRTLTVEGIRDLRVAPLKSNSKSTLATAARPFLLNARKGNEYRSYYLTEVELLSLS